MRHYDGMEMGYDPAIEQIDQQIETLRRRRLDLLEKAEAPKLPAAEFTMITLAHEAGQMSALYRNSEQKCTELKGTIEKLQSKVDGLEGIQLVCDQWRERAEKAELTLKRSRSARRR